MTPRSFGIGILSATLGFAAFRDPLILAGLIVAAGAVPFYFRSRVRL